MTDLHVVVCVSFDHRAPPDGLASFKDCICNCPFVESAMEVSGTFDMIVQGHCSNFAEFSENMERIRAPLAQYVRRIDTNFVSRKISKPDGKESVALWLPCERGRRRVESSRIDKIVAEGDYMRVHVGEWSCLLHETMQHLADKLRHGFIRLHRSCLVRIGFIDRIVHDERRWRAHLCDGTQVNIAKSHSQQVLELISNESSKLHADSPKPLALTERPKMVNERIMIRRN